MSNIFDQLQEYKSKCDHARTNGNRAALLQLKRQGIKLPPAPLYLKGSVWYGLSRCYTRLASPDAGLANEMWDWVLRQKARYNGQNPPVLARKMCF